MKFPCNRFLSKSVATAIILLLIFICYANVVWGADSEDPRPRGSEKSVVQETANKQLGFRLVAYVPPKRGKPGGRIGGGTRGEGTSFPAISVLAPDHLGLTVRAQPDLYYYVSNSSNKPIEFTLNLEQEGKTVVHKDIKGVLQEGIYRLNLSDLGVNLYPNTWYTWFVTMVLDPDQPSTDIFSGGTIMRVNPSKVLEKKLASAGKEDFPSIYAAEGVWYEALSSLSRLIDEDPENKTLYLQRANLLKQVGLEGEAALDRKASGDIGFHP